MFSLVLYLHFTRSFDPKLGEFESVVQVLQLFIKCEISFFTLVNTG